MFKETPVKKYILRTLILILCLAMVMVMLIPITQFESDQDVKNIVFIVFGSVAGACIIAYWIYVFVREYKIAHPGITKKKDKKTDDK